MLRAAYLVLLAAGMAAEQAPAAPPLASPPSVGFRYPRRDNTTDVNALGRVMIDLNVSGWTFPSDGEVCLDVGELSCHPDPSNVAIVLPFPGEFSFSVHLVRHAAPGEESADAHARIVASDWVTLTAVNRSECEGRFGLPPCAGNDVQPPLPHYCGALPRFRFFLYEVASVPSDQAAELYYALRDSPRRTADPAQACVFIALTDPLAANRVWDSALDASRRLTRAPLWGSGGERHLFFHYGDYEPAFDTARAVLLKSSFGPPLVAEDVNPSKPESVLQIAQARRGYDVTIPLPFHRCGYRDDAHLTRFSAQVAAGAILPAVARTLLASFRGALYGLPQSHFASARGRLRAAAHNGRDVIVALTCWSVAPRCDCPRDKPQCGYANITSSRAPECAQLHAEAAAADYEYDALLLRSRFAFVPPGEGTHSYRLYEALQAGAVPVLLGPSALPLPELINWDAISVRQEDTSERALAALVRRLRAIPPERVQAMQDAGRLVFESHFRDLRAQLEAIFGALAVKFLAASRQAVHEATIAAAAVTNSSSPSSSPAPTVAAATASEAVIPTASASVAVPDGVLEMRGGAAKRRRAAQQQQLQQQTAGSPSPAAVIRDALELAQALSARLSAQVAAYHAELGQLTAAEEAAAAAQRVAVDAAGNVVPTALPRPVAHTAETDITLLRQAVAALLAHLGTVASPASALVRRRRDTLWALASLSQLYSLAGHWRAALTAAQARAVLFPFDADAAAADGVDAGEEAVRALVVRVCNALYDARRPPAPAPWGHARPTVVAPSSDDVGSVAPHRPFGRFYRVVDELTDADDAVFAGYGGLSGLLGPTPLADVGAPGAAVLPLAPRGVNRRGSGLYHPDALLPQVAVDEATLQAVAARVASDGGALPARLPDFLAAHGDRVETTYLNGPSARVAATSDADDGASPPPPSRVAIVSLCVYNDTATALGRLSIANLQAYCEAHGYDCFVGTGGGAVDARRPIAWSKLLLAAQYLPTYEWLLWKDCDSLITNMSVRVEDVVAAAAAARGVIASATADVVYAGDGAPEVTVDEAVASAAAAGWAQPSSPAPLPYGPAGIAAAAAAAGGAVALPSAPSLDLIASEDGLMLNSGVFLLRNGAWGRGLLQRAYGVLADQLSADSAAAAGDGGRDAMPFYSRTGGDGAVPTATHAPPADPAVAGAAATAAMRAAPLPMATNRAWEQASLFHLLALGGLPATAPGCGGGDGDSSSGCCVATAPVDAAASEPLPSLGGAHVSAPLAGALRGAVCGAGALRPAAFADVARTQFVPQAWLNAYPPQLAGQIYDHHARPMHAAWAPGDWVVSFSGCGMLLAKGDADACERLYAQYAALAQAPQGAG